MALQDPFIEQNYNRAFDVVDTIKQSAPVDVTKPVDLSHLRGKTILITGAASGLGAAFARRWAAEGAQIIVADRNDELGQAVVADLQARGRVENGRHDHVYVHCDVTSWEDQVATFRAAARASATGNINAVVANAGASALSPPGLGTPPPSNIEEPPESVGFGDEDEDDPGDGGGANASPRQPPPPPPPPKLTVIKVNVIGVMYTMHLAMYWLARDAKKKQKKVEATKEEEEEEEEAKADKAGLDSTAVRDRHLLLIGSLGGMVPAVVGEVEYCVSKHAVTGLFRTLRSTAFLRGIRVNMLCPHFVNTPILGSIGFAFVAGSGGTKVEDVVAAATRFMADESIVGRALAVGPRLPVVYEETAGGKGGPPPGHASPRMVDGKPVMVVKGGCGIEKPPQQAVWELYGHDYDQADIFARRMLWFINTVAAIRGWLGFVSDLVTLFTGKKDKQEKAGARKPPVKAAKKIVTVASGAFGR